MGIHSSVATIDFLPTSDVDRAGVLTLVGAVLTSENSFELQIQTQLWLKVSICLGSACFLSSQCRYAFSPTDENINRKLRKIFSDIYAGLFHNSPVSKDMTHDTADFI